MIVLVLIITAFIALAFFLRGEGENYAGNSNRKNKGRFGVSDKNYFL
jgi:hypothetical protein